MLPGEMKYPNLFSHLDVGKLHFKNRYVQPPNIKGHANADGSVNQRTIDNYYTEARGGAAGICVMASYVRIEGKAFINQIAIDRDDVIGGLADLAYAIKRAGALSGIQIFHGGAICDPRRNNYNIPVSPYYMPSFRNPNIMCHELTKREIRVIIDAYAAAAGRALEAGFDYVMVHGNHGSLPHQFLSPTFNSRKDEYGSDRLLFSQKVYERMREVVGDSYPIVWRISAEEFGGDKGYSLDLMLDEYVPRYIEWGINILDVSAGGIMSPVALSYTIPPLYLPRGTNLKYAEAVRKIAVKKGIPVVGVGKIMDPEIAEAALKNGRCDLINIARPIFADPELPKKAREGRVNEIRRCIACNWCTTTHVFNHHSCMCAVNPSFGRERDYALRDARIKKKVYIAGGGVAGMKAAKLLKMRGHDVTLFEKTNQLGGIIHVASAHLKLNTKDLRNVVVYLKNQMDILKINVKLETELTKDIIEKDKPDVVIAATGGKPINPNIPGIKNKNVIYHDDYLSNQASYEIGNNVVIIGGGDGAELGVSIRRLGKNVTILEQSNNIAVVPYIHDLMRHLILLKYIHEEGVNVITGANVRSISQSDVEYTLSDGKNIKLAYDTVIIATGRDAEHSLYDSIQDVVKESYLIGDAVQPRSIATAIDDAAYVGRTIGAAEGDYFPTGGSNNLYPTHAKLMDAEMLELILEREGKR